MLRRLFGKNNPEPAPASEPAPAVVDLPPVPTVTQSPDRPSILGVTTSDKSVFTTTASSLIALDLATGRKRFARPMELKPVGSPTADGTSVFYMGQVGSYSQIVAVEPTWGGERWRSDSAEMLVPELSTVASPYGGVVCALSLIGPMTFNAETGKVEGMLATGKGVPASNAVGVQHAVALGIYPLRLGDEGFVGIGISEKEARWRTVMHPLCPNAPLIVTSSGRLISLGRDDQLGCADVQTGRGLMRMTIDDACSAAGDIASEANDQLMFVAIGNKLTAYDLIALEAVWEQPIEPRGGRVIGMSGNGDTLFLSERDNFIFAFDADTGAIRWAGQCPGAAAPMEFVPAGEGVILVSSTNLALDGSVLNPTVSLRETATGSEVWTFTVEDM